MNEKRVFIKGFEVNYKVIGEGKPLLILHGWGSSSDSWQKVQKNLAALQYKIICPDFPGFGKSKTPSRPWSITNYTEWLSDFINFLNLEKFSIISHSFGGRVATKFTAYYPEKIESLILCAPAGIKIKASFKRRIALTLAIVGDVIFSLNFLRVFKDAARNLFYIFLRRTDYVKASSVMRETMKKVLGEDLSPYLSKIKAKTLIVWGKEDRVIPVKFAYIFKDKIENSRLEILAKIGHSPHLEVPEKLSEIIIKFLKS